MNSRMCSWVFPWLYFPFCLSLSSLAQEQRELNKGWKCRKASLVKADGANISQHTHPINGWIPATVPGTILTTLLANKLIPDPFYGMNNKLIPDIYNVGAAEYTYWFVEDFLEKAPAKGEHVSLQFRGINYSCDIFFNGHQLNSGRAAGMYFRHNFDITQFLKKDGRNRLAVIVYPPNPPGNPNGGQGGDGMIAHSITNQYAAGWDWIQPIADRNTGIWDKVFLKRTKQLSIENTHVVTEVPGKRFPGTEQSPAQLKVSSEVTNSSSEMIDAVIRCEVDGQEVLQKITLAPGSTREFQFPEITIKNPRLWWPNGYGDQPLYEVRTMVLMNGKTISDEDKINVGIREITTTWNTTTNSRQIFVNCQPIFIKGGNRILSDELLRFSKERYDAEVRFHRDMNLNLIRVWGGGITERPEFYDACDKYGLLVMQDFWVSGDCNGRWYDPMKLEDTNARRQYPDDHPLFVRSLEDQIKMLRNHPSLALWCGGNEIRPPHDVLTALRDTLLPHLDPTRFFFEFSNDDSMSLHGGDGPYTIQPIEYFWKHKSFPFNSEIGSVGIGDKESLERFLPKENQIPPNYDAIAHKWMVDSVWQYHKYIGYDSAIEKYGHPTDLADFTRKAQLVNYDQYRALFEGAGSHMWEYYTGIINWKTQNPWTAMLGQMYDVYLDPNACLYGTREGCKQLHVMYDPEKKAVMVVNNGFRPTGKLKLIERYNDTHELWVTIDTIEFELGPSTVKIINQIGNSVDKTFGDKGYFMNLELYDGENQRLLDDNLYWMPDRSGQYSGLATLSEKKVVVKLGAPKKLGNGSFSREVTISNSAPWNVAFFIRLSIIDSKSQKRILPVFYSDNYISVWPGQNKTITLEYPWNGAGGKLRIEGWNVKKMEIGL